jgi:glutamate racemase
VNNKRQTILVFDSGAGGLTVLDPIRKARPDAHYIYVADNAVFPYGELSEDVLLSRVRDVFDAVIPRFNPDLVVIACHTASTLVLPMIRARFSIPFVGTVPAIKPAAEHSQSRIIGILATRGTAQRDYTAALIRDFAQSCEVILHAPSELASKAEAALNDESVTDASILADIAPCFVEHDGKRTDTIVLACTHYPLLLVAFERVAPWPVTWIDPAPAIARRVVQLMGEASTDKAPEQPVQAVFTGPFAISAPLLAVLKGYGLEKIDFIAIKPASAV